MDVVVVSRKENPLLERTEVRFRVVHTGEKTPERELVRERLAGMLNERKELVIIDRMRSQFGKQETSGYAKVYKSRERAMRVERDRTLVRNKLKERKPKSAQAQAPKAEEEAKTAKPEAPKTPPKEEEKPGGKAPEKKQG
ncbi:MAG: 30S ribosomal protein S24e [Thermoplasmatota archaeon]